MKPGAPAYSERLVFSLTYNSELNKKSATRNWADHLFAFPFILYRVARPNTIAIKADFFHGVKDVECRPNPLFPKMENLQMT
jgi:hypothetical protein